MSDNEMSLNKTLDILLQKLEQQEQDVSKTKQLINGLCEAIGREKMFDIIDSFTGAGRLRLKIDHDTFFGMGVAPAVKQFLKMNGKAALIEEIFDALSTGGFEWPKDWKQKLRLKNLAISLSKNRYDFVIVDTAKGNAYGLWEFYPDKLRERDKTKSIDKKSEVIEESETENDEEKKK
ncbi:hypothetical protein K1X84_05720 [bacterium]|nr:hypothetical protein [bacterium]